MPPTQAPQPLPRSSLCHQPKPPPHLIQPPAQAQPAQANPQVAMPVTPTAGAACGTMVQPPPPPLLVRVEAPPRPLPPPARRHHQLPAPRQRLIAHLATRLTSAPRPLKSRPCLPARCVGPTMLGGEVFLWRCIACLHISDACSLYSAQGCAAGRARLVELAQRAPWRAVELEPASRFRVWLNSSATAQRLHPSLVCRLLP